MNYKFIQRLHMLFVCFMGILFFLVALLIWEYYYFWYTVQELVVLREYYQYCLLGLEGRAQKKHSNLLGVASISCNGGVDTICVNNHQDIPIEYEPKKEAGVVLQDDDKEYTQVSNVPYSLSFDTHNIIPAQKQKRNFDFIWPIDHNKFWLSSLFGPRKRLDGTYGFHHGIDMAAHKGTVVKSVAAGRVVEAHFQIGYGNTVVIQHAAHIRTRYAHLNAIYVHVGQKMGQGTVIGTVGETGFIRKKGKDGSHLHFEVYEQGKRINPLHCLSSLHGK